MTRRLNQTAAVNAPIAPWFQFGHPWRRVTEHQRWADIIRIVIIALVSFTVVDAFAEWRSEIKGKEPLAVALQPSVVKEPFSTVIYLTNTTKAVLQYSGYGKDNPTQYWEHFQKGKWVETLWPWCGTGLYDYSLAPGARITFRFTNEELAPGSRVYTIVRSADSTRASFVLLYEQKPRPTKRLHRMPR